MSIYMEISDQNKLTKEVVMSDGHSIGWRFDMINFRVAVFSNTVSLSTWRMRICAGSVLNMQACL